MTGRKTKGKEGALGTVLKLVAPMARKHITAENMRQMFEAITAPYEYPGERTMIVISRKGDGNIVGSIVGVDEENRIASQYDQQPIDQLISRFLEDSL